MMRFREAFDPSKTFVLQRLVRLEGGVLEAGTIFPRDAVPMRRLRVLFDTKVLAYPNETGRSKFLPLSPKRVHIGEERAAPMPPPPALIPENWRELAWASMAKLAANFAKVRPANKAEAEFAIEAELEKRARAPRGDS